MKIITEAEAENMTREEALRALATAEGVPPATRRAAQLMLAGPEVKTVSRRPRMTLMGASVAAALDQVGEASKQERADEVRDLTGGWRG